MLHSGQTCSQYYPGNLTDNRLQGPRDEKEGIEIPRGTVLTLNDKKGIQDFLIWVNWHPEAPSIDVPRLGSTATVFQI